MNSLIVLGILAALIFISLVYIFRKQKIILLILFLLAAMGGWMGYKEYNRTNPDLATVKADNILSANELIQAYEKNDSSANKKYLGKILEITGTVKEVKKDEAGFYTIVLGSEGNLSSVRCLLDSTHQDNAANITTGSSATIRGSCTGFNKDEMGLGSDVILNRAVIVGKK